MNDAAGAPPTRQRLLALSLLLVGVILVFRSTWPTPPPLSDRALSTLNRVAASPRPTGSPAASALREWLVQELKATGLSVHVQAEAVLTPARPATMGAVVENVVACREGRASTGTLLLSSHSDSVPQSFGAADAGAGVTALLEAARALPQNPRNTVCFLITDAEELGLLGALAFVNEHDRWAEVRAVLNFEARGLSGPSVMFRSTGASGGLIEALAQVPYVVASSLGPAVFEQLPNDTDLSQMRARPGLDFAFVDGLLGYHSSLDQVAEVDLNSVAHHIHLAKALTVVLADADLQHTTLGDPVYFSTPLGLVRYPASWAPPLAGLAVGVLIFGLALRRVSWWRTLVVAAVTTGLGIALVPLTWFYVTQLTALLPGELRQGGADSAFRELWRLMLPLGGMGGLTALGHAFYQRWGLATIGSLLPVSLLGLGLSASYPGASYVLTLPGLLLAGTLLVNNLYSTMNIVIRVALMLCAVAVALPVVLLLPPVVPLSAIGVVGLLPCWLVPACVPALDRMGLLPSVRSCLVLAFGVPLLLPLIHPIMYQLNKPPTPIDLVWSSDDSRAVWQSRDPSATPWLQQLFGLALDQDSSERVTSAAAREAPAPGATLPGPKLTVVWVERDGNALAELKIEPDPLCFRVDVRLRGKGELRQLRVAGRDFQLPSGTEQLRWSAPPPEGLTLYLSGERGSYVEVTEVHPGWPTLPVGADAGGWYLAATQDNGQSRVTRSQGLPDLR